ncbi:hypothetical protein RB195_017104 [Necator americanus]|uniref:Uncharacterized protein n=1 Tax=Necator americanus TaxID=51031 RepID=A0ABR1C6T2_NECAM
MISGVQFGPKLSCFDVYGKSSDHPVRVEAPRRKKESSNRRGKFTVFDDEPVCITPTHPLAQAKKELSELWTRKDEDLDWNSMINSESISTHSKQQYDEKRRSLDEMTSMEFAQAWSVVADSAKDNTSRKSTEMLDEFEQEVPTSSTFTSSHISTDVDAYQRSYADLSTVRSTTGLEDSRISFALHDLTGPVRTKRREKELMKYMGVNNLDFNIAKRHAPKDNEEVMTGVFLNGVFRSKSREATTSESVIVERMFPDPARNTEKEIAAYTNNDSGTKLQSSVIEAKDITSLIRQISQSRADLMCTAMDGHATLESAERMFQRANDWFSHMLDELEKRIKNERNLEKQNRRHIEKMLHPVVQKLCDLQLVYEALDFLDKRTKTCGETVTRSKDNMRNARRIIAKLMSLDSKRSQPTLEPGNTYNLASETSTAFHQMEQSLLETSPFTARSTLAAKLIDTVITQMRGIHKTVIQEIPRRLLSEYLAHLGPPTAKTSKGAPPMIYDTRKLLSAPRRRKYCPYIKLDPWPTEGSRISDTDVTNSSTILSAKISTVSLSDYHESAMSNTPTDSGLSHKADIFVDFNVNKNLSEDQPPSAVGTRGCTASDTSLCNSFEEAKIIRNPLKRNENAPKSTAPVVAAPHIATVPQSAATIAQKPSKTPDPIRSRIRKEADSKVSKRKKALNELLDKKPKGMSPLNTARTQISDPLDI